MKKVLAAMSGILFSVFCIAVLGLLMSFTLQALQKLFPDSFTNQMWGLVLFDIAAMIWGLAFVFKSESVGQYATAAIGFVTAFAGTLLMVTFEVMTSGQTFVKDNGSLGQWAVYGFIIVTAVHAALIYAHHASAPDIHAKINIGIAQGGITTEAIKQATGELERQQSELAMSIRQKLVDDVKRELHIPIAVDPNVGFVPAQPQYSDVPYPVTHPAEKKQSWFDRMKGTLKPQPSMKKNEQTIIQQVELVETDAQAAERIMKYNAQQDAEHNVRQGKPTRSPYALPCGHTEGVVMNSNADGYLCRVCSKPVSIDELKGLQEGTKPATDAPFPGEPKA